MKNTAASTRFMIVNYSASAVLNVLFNSAIVAGLISLIAGSGALPWAAMTLCLFISMMMLRNRIVKREITDGLHDPQWGRHIRRQRQRERDAANESHWLTRPLFRFACFIGIHKKP